MSEPKELIRLLGDAPVLFGVPGGTLVPLGQQKMWALLATLALGADQEVPLKELSDALWGDSPPPAAPAAIARYVSRWQKILNPYGVQIEPGFGAGEGYALGIESWEVDVNAFAMLAQTVHHTVSCLPLDRLAEPDEIPQDLSEDLLDLQRLWPHQAPPSFPYIKSPSLHQRTDEHLKDLWLHTLHDRTVLRMHLGQCEESAAELAALATAHPLREE